MNFYNVDANIPEDAEDKIEDAVDDGADRQEAIIGYHLEKAQQAIQTIGQKDEHLARAIADAIMHGLLAVNAASHDIFQLSTADRNEDIATRIRKNR
ncbi:MAG: hypothetical protein ABIS50_05095 [Luteolibacter sp.]|uniref:hypothetical protein n=1 Tax=Luteolibacter sp. TaxID=1962973 RepID=UPI0032649066